MARTTIAIDDEVLRALKLRAAAEASTLAAVTNRLLRVALQRTEEASGYQLELPEWSAQVQPGVDLLDRRSLHDRLDGRD